ncbi:hypothetical protein KP509_17G082400 [Ceratopteris richardii]|uniref:Uncharacterized protein n=1 Tax=Ceratopteris richardii TaxID=49495 RepID=A0A8T2T021_CERRI|nr:hypothetical protein KP509_17G082400 [Ceratopteris richardii]
MVQCSWLPSYACFRRIYLHTSAAVCFPRKRPGTRNPLPEEEIQKRVEAIVHRTRKKPKPKDEIDWDFKKVGDYDIKDEEIQRMYKEYLRLYHPEMAGDEMPASEEDKDSKMKGTSGFKDTR